ncbi:hypothetical protein [Xanthomonas cannabis]|uniref:Lipoprotein n=1 Tax=Xanthomonas cannabis TaxID=1885674 RepID=A0ABR6JFJ6_9XANT|nr:hypothetical protein [Xanthomonas cannabis]MBB4591540.1 hypothetical protein [Xanthomonas cannabis]MBB5521245.1 hypothetical protein [Xanthomonas cannabis]
MSETISAHCLIQAQALQTCPERRAAYTHVQIGAVMRGVVLLLMSVFVAACSRTSPSDKANRPDLVGTIGPNVIRVPARDLLFYESEPGTKELKGKCERPLRSLVIRLRWPGMEPLNENNAEDYQVHHRQSVGDSQWIEIGMTRLTPTEKVTLSGTRDFLLYRKRIVSSYPDGLPLTYGYSADAGLKFAHLSTPLPHEVNSIVYSDQIEKGHDSSILIDCTHGAKYDPPRWTPLCDQLIIEPSFPQVKFRVSYRANLLPEWPQITSAVHSYLQKTRAQCPSKQEVKELNHG